MNEVIKVSGIKKSYTINHRLERNAHPTLRDDIAYLSRKPLEWIGALGGTSNEEIWALKGIDFEVNRGEVVGIMGRNGSGKSTLLKILSRVTAPTSGTVELYEKTASMLEVGTGFHPELTGRENVYFNGSILGMKKEQINKHFDQIVQFAEVENFLDTPVKFYSSGMKVRLAFAVAAHLDADILIIDEVLAVGDVKFKRKSLEHMKRIAEESNKTILFVSHIVSQIETLCTRGIVLEKGSVVYDGSVRTAVNKYLELNETESNSDEDDVYSNPDQQHAGIDIKDVEISLKKTQSFPDLSISYTLLNPKGVDTTNLWFAAIIVNANGTNVALIDSTSTGRMYTLSNNDKESIVTINIDSLNVRPGKYFLRLGLRDDEAGNVLRRVDKAGSFIVPEYRLGDAAINLPREVQPPMVLKTNISLQKR